MRLEDRDTIVTAWAESCGGPGWSNRVIWVLVRDGMGSLRMECLQPKEQGAWLLDLFDVSEAAFRATTFGVKRLFALWGNP